jgi:Mn-dependent DtxR family transcriptional regulator
MKNLRESGYIEMDNEGYITLTKAEKRSPTPCWSGIRSSPDG